MLALPLSLLVAEHRQVECGAFFKRLICGQYELVAPDAQPCSGNRLAAFVTHATADIDPAIEIHYVVCRQ